MLVPVLLLAFVLMLVHLPRVAATAWDSLGVRYDAVSAALDDGAATTVAANGVQLLTLLLPVCGMVLTTWRVGSRGAGGAWRWSADSPARRGGLVTVGTAALALAAFTWWPNGDYRPIQPDERGTLAGSFDALSAVPTGRPSLTEERAAELDGAPTVREQGGDFRDVRDTDDEEQGATDEERGAADGERERNSEDERGNDRREGRPQGRPDPHTGSRGHARADTGARHRAAGPRRADADADAHAGARRHRDTDPDPDPHGHPMRLLRLLALLLVAAVAALAPATTAWADDDDGGGNSGDNLAQAVNEEDGGDVFDLAFDIRRVMNGVVDQTNTAVAYSSCSNCRTIAIAVQVVLVMGPAETVNPENVALAINENCTTCETLASAYQIVLGTGGPVRFTREARNQVREIQEALAALGDSDAPIADIKAEADRLVADLKAVLQTGLVPVREEEDDDDDDRRRRRAREAP